MAKLFVRESLLQEREGNKVRCNVCERRCLLLEGAFGWCRTRQNRGGRLVTLIYGCVSSLSANPIEKKPFYHFHPGSLALTAGSWSCNFGCPWCQNWEISKAAPPAEGNYVSPEGFMRLSRRAQAAKGRPYRSTSQLSPWSGHSTCSAWPEVAGSLTRL